MSKNENKGLAYCSFCGRSETQVRGRIVTGEGKNGQPAYICAVCVEKAAEALDAYGGYDDVLDDEYSVYKPREIREYLDQYVIGQDEAKKALSVAVYNHYKRIISYEDRNSEIELSKSNILLLGPTGVGKTYLAQILAKMMNVPFAIADATSLTEAGYVGDDVENILLRLIQAADYDIARAQRGIIYVDEIDKIARRSDNPSITRDVSGEGVQQALLKIFEGTVASVPPHGGRKHPQQDFIQIDTTNILFICGGAFDGLERIVEQRLNKKVIGFGSETPFSNEKSKDDILKKTLPQDLHKYGLIPELIGRLPVVVALSSLDEDSLMEILSKPKNSITQQYQHLFELDNVILEFQDDALRSIAKKAIDRGTGARGLRAIVEDFLTDAMFTIPDSETIERCVITKATVEDGAPPEYIHNENRQPLPKRPRKRRGVKRSDAS